MIGAYKRGQAAFEPKRGLIGKITCAPPPLRQRVAHPVQERADFVVGAGRKNFQGLIEEQCAAARSRIVKQRKDIPRTIACHDLACVLRFGLSREGIGL